MIRLRKISADRKNRSNQRMQVFILINLFFLFFGSSCNIFEEGEGAFTIVVNSLPSTAGNVVASGQGNVELFAVPNENWSFSHWSGDVESTSNPLQIMLTQNTQIFANFVLAGDETRIKLRVSDGRFITDLEFGRVQGATDDFDSTIDLEAPPSPPDGVLFAWFQSGEKRLLYDFRNPYGLSQEWRLNIVPGENPSIEISWEIEGSNAAGTWLLSNSDQSRQIDLLSANSAAFQLSAPEIFSIVYMGSQ